MSHLPIVCIPCNHTEWQEAPSHVVKHQYIRPLLEIVKAVPLLIPAIGASFDLKSVAGRVDGLLLTGAGSHVGPEHYGAKREFEEHNLDANRDATSLPLIRSAIEMDMPIFAICRGFQEMNVACGGTLHQHVHEQAGKLDHRAPRGLDIKKRYEERRHEVRTQEGGMFTRLGVPASFAVNSLHQQGIDKLGSGLFVEAISEDGLIEAVSVPKKRFILGTQWHPEGDFWLNPVSVTLFEAFARALRAK
jgi:putative glutamine amidotransferase